MVAVRSFRSQYFFSAAFPSPDARIHCPEAILSKLPKIIFHPQFRKFPPGEVIFQFVKFIFEVVKMIFEVVKIIFEVVKIIFEVVKKILQFVKITFEIMKIIFEVVRMTFEVVKIIFQFVRMIFEVVKIIYPTRKWPTICPILGPRPPFSRVRSLAARDVAHRPALFRH